MIFQQLSKLLLYFINNFLRETLTAEQTFLKNLTSEDFSRKEAAELCAKIFRHQSSLSEKLDRRLSIEVAAVDYFENFYETEDDLKKLRRFNGYNLSALGNLSAARM